MKPRDIEITLRVHTAAPLPVLRDPKAYSQTVIDTTIGSHFIVEIQRATVREIEPWENDPQAELELKGGT